MRRPARTLLLLCRGHEGVCAAEALRELVCCPLLPLAPPGSSAPLPEENPGYGADVLAETADSSLFLLCGDPPAAGGGK